MTLQRISKATLGSTVSRAELLSRIEHAFGVQLTVDTFARADCANDVLEALQTIEHSDAAAEKILIPVEYVAQANARTVPEPIAASTLCEALRWHAARAPERTHLILEDDTLGEIRISYEELHRETMKITGGLRSIGIERGNTVALMLPTSRDYFVCFLAILLCRAIPVPLYPPARLRALEEHVARNAAILANAQFKALISFDKAAAVARLLALRAPLLCRVLTPQQVVGTPLDPIIASLTTDVAFCRTHRAVRVTRKASR